MDHKELIKNCLANSLNCLESDDYEGGIEVVSFGTEDEPYVLNFQIEGNSVKVSVLDRDRKIIVDSYDEEFDEETLEQKVADAEVAYRVIKSAKPEVEAKLEKECWENCKECVGMIRTACDNVLNAAELSTQQALVGDLVGAFDVNRSVLTQYCSDSVELPAEPGEIAEDAIEQVVDTAEETSSEIPESASMTDMLKIIAGRLASASYEAGSEVNQRILADLAAQADEMRDEIESMLGRS